MQELAKGRTASPTMLRYLIENMIDYYTEINYKGFVDIPFLNLTKVKAEVSLSKGKLVSLAFSSDIYLDIEDPRQITNACFYNDSCSIYLYDFLGNISTSFFATGYHIRISATSALYSSNNSLDWQKITFKKISLHTNNINLWLLPYISKNYIKKVNEIKSYVPNIDITIKVDADSLKIYDSFSYIEKNLKDHKYELITKGFLNLENVNSFYTLSQAEDIVRDMELILAILTGFSQNPRTIKLNNDIYLYKLSFFKYTGLSPIYETDFVFQAKDLKDNNLFKSIFESYFNKKEEIKNTYHGLWGLINSNTNTFNEDNFFRLFSMMDSITRYKNIDREIPFSEKQKKLIVKNIKEVLRPIVDSIVSETNPPQEIVKDYKKIKVNIRKRVLSNNTLFYLQKIQKIWKYQISEAAKKIIDLTDDKLRKLTKIRNAIAHASPLPDFFAREGYPIYYKTLLLIMYLLWKDLGISDETIFKSIKWTNNKVSYACNRDELDIYNGVALRLNFDDTEYKKLESLKQGVVAGSKKTIVAVPNIVIEAKDNSFHINVENTEALRKIMSEKRFPTEVAAVKTLYPKEVVVKFMPKILIDKREYAYHVYHVFVVWL